MKLDEYKKIVFLGGGILANRLYDQIYDIENKLVGVVDLLDDNSRQIKEFKGHKIINANDYIDVLKSSDVAVLVAVGHYAVYKIVEDFVLKFSFIEDRLFVVNPYCSLRFFCVDDDLASDKRIPFKDSRYGDVKKMLNDNLSIDIFNLLINSKPFENNSDTYEIIPYIKLKKMYWYTEDYWNTYYFDDDINNIEATVLDCGAYIGDSVLNICNAIPEKDIYYYAMEPLKDNIEVINNTKEFWDVCKEFKVYECGVGKKDDKMYFKLPENGYKEGGRFVKESSDNIETLEIRAIDNLDIDVKGTLYIKMDIEGAEMDALYGAQDIIKKYHPYLAICLYHRKNDLVDIPLYVKSLYSNYRIYLRGGYHTIMWAIPDNY